MALLPAGLVRGTEDSAWLRGRRLNGSEQSRTSSLNLESLSLTAHADSTRRATAGQGERRHWVRGWEVLWKCILRRVRGRRGRSKGNTGLQGCCWIRSHRDT